MGGMPEPSRSAVPFARGARAALDGLKTAFSDKGVQKAYFRVALGLFALTLVIDVGALWTLFAFTPVAEVSSTVMLALYWAARILGSLAILLVGPMIAMFVINIVFPFFNQEVFLAGMRAVDPERADRLAALEGMPMRASAWGATRRFFKYLALSLGLLLLGLVPVVGSIAAAVLGVWLAARTVGWELLDPYFECIDMRHAEQREFVRTHRDTLVGFGLPLSLLLAIPLLGPALFGMAQAAAGTYIIRELPVDPRESVGG